MPELNFTPEQRAAIDTRGSTVLVSAAAGSGKTRVLTERLMAYLTDAEHPVDIDHFLVITYTRAAAAELSSRILDGIYARIASDPENRRLRRQVALCARAEIGTIHSFCADFLRANCAALALAPDFQVADTERCAALRAAALEHTLERAYTRLDTDAPFRLLADTVGGGRDDARLGELVLSLYDKMQCHARPEQWAQRQVDLLALGGVTDAGATPWGQALLARVRESAAHWAGVLDKQLDIMAAQDMAWLYGIYGTSFAETADGLRAVVRACDQSWDAAVAALQNVPFPRLGSTRKPPDPDVRDRVKAQRDAAKKAIQALQKQINVPSAQALADRFIVFRDEYGAVSRLLLELIRAEALARGYHIITCPCAMHPEDKIDHILIPELRLAFLTDNRWHPVQLPGMQAVRCTRFLDRENLAGYRARLRFNERAAAELLEQATALMAQAKSCHDELETYYRTTVDFAQVDEAAARCAELFGLEVPSPDC